VQALGQLRDIQMQEMTSPYERPVGVGQRDRLAPGCDLLAETNGDDLALAPRGRRSVPPILLMVGVPEFVHREFMGWHVTEAVPGTTGGCVGVGDDVCGGPVRQGAASQPASGLTAAAPVRL